MARDVQLLQHKMSTGDNLHQHVPLTRCHHYSVYIPYHTQCWLNYTQLIKLYFVKLCDHLWHCLLHVTCLNFDNYLSPCHLSTVFVLTVSLPSALCRCHWRLTCQALSEPHFDSCPWSRRHKHAPSSCGHKQGRERGRSSHGKVKVNSCTQSTSTYKGQTWKVVF